MTQLKLDNKDFFKRVENAIKNVIEDSENNIDYLRCSKCGRVLAHIENGEVVFKDKRIIAPLTKFIICRGDPHQPCGEINYIK